MKKRPVILIVFVSFALFLVFSILQNYLVYRAIQHIDLDKASQLSQTAIILPKIMNTISFQQITSLKLWEFTLKQLPAINQLQKDSQLYLAQIINNEPIDKTLPKKIVENLEKINEELNKIDAKQLNKIKSIFNEVLIIAKKLLSEDVNYIVLLQNNDELRATGGFMGSYFVLASQDGQISLPQIQDIYAPDGQFKGFLKAPKGMEKYLSSGNGMRLPDANWWPNFPDSAEQILYFFEETEKKDYQGVIAINLHTIEELLDLTGDVYLPDYRKSVNKNNFASIAREDRNNFFPGSQEKVNFLNHFLKMFKFQFIESMKKNPQKFIALGQELIKSKELQFYSRNQEIAAILDHWQADGSMKNGQAGLYYFLVESNVGINKANRLVNRQITINIKQEQETININFQNANQYPYVNYQRLYTNADTTLLNIKINGQKVEEIDQRIMTTKNSQTWQEIGFLVPVLTNNSSNVEINLASKLSIDEKKEIFIQKQSGLQATDYIIHYQDQSKSFKLSGDQSINFN
ncbi:MAG TPA: DUF4012 domain-containing protein [Candidatus Woesebacteria bacterium]|nr:DUF4012 domain-containing protein [Candidatus Woesebacteria bacterium]